MNINVISQNPFISNKQNYEYQNKRGYGNYPNLRPLQKDTVSFSKKSSINETKTLTENNSQNTNILLWWEDYGIKFRQTPEGIRRNNMSDKEIETQAILIYNKAFDELKVPLEQRPKLKIISENNLTNGEYCRKDHLITINKNPYLNGLCNLENTIMHEATHAKEALLRAGIPQHRIDEILQDKMLSAIKKNKDTIFTVTGEKFKRPKMSEEMRNDFVKFAQENIFKEDFIINITKEINEYETEPAPILDRIYMLLENHPEFSKQYSSEQESISRLFKYIVELGNNYISNRDIHVGSLKVPKLSDEKLKQAEKSYKDYIYTKLGNIINQNNLAGKNSYGVYEITPEEVLAQKNGNNYLIKKYTEELETMRKTGNINPEREKYLNFEIEKAQLTIQYKELGLNIFTSLENLSKNFDDFEQAKEQFTKNPPKELVDMYKKMLEIKKSIKICNEKILNIRLPE